MLASTNLPYESQVGSKETTAPACSFKYFLTTAMDASTNSGLNPTKTPK
jgi:hypothetical protein